MTLSEAFKPLIDVFDVFNEPDDQTAKADNGKPKLTLVPPQIMFEIESVRSYGNKKYHDPNNWRNVSIERYWEATLRHIFAAWNNVRAVDPESGLKHISHASCNLAFILQMLKDMDETIEQIEGSMKE